ncbi:MAG: hypothetical protein ACOZJX_14110 [Pseudomonadota bacterium]
MATSKRPSLAELTTTVARMETRLQAHSSAAVGQAFRLYQRLVPRFEADLGAASRDLALARASALMLVQALAQAEAVQPPAEGEAE